MRAELQKLFFEIFARLGLFVLDEQNLPSSPFSVLAENIKRQLDEIKITNEPEPHLDDKNEKKLRTIICAAMELFQGKKYAEYPKFLQQLIHTIDHKKNAAASDQEMRHASADFSDEEIKKIFLEMKIDISETDIKNLIDDFRCYLPINFQSLHDELLKIATNHLHTLQKKESHEYVQAFRFQEMLAELTDLTNAKQKRRLCLCILALIDCSAEYALRKIIMQKFVFVTPENFRIACNINKVRNLEEYSCYRVFCELYVPLAPKNYQVPITNWNYFHNYLLRTVEGDYLQSNRGRAKGRRKAAKVLDKLQKIKGLCDSVERSRSPNSTTAEASISPVEDERSEPVRTEISRHPATVMTSIEIKKIALLVSAVVESSSKTLRNLILDYRITAQDGEDRTMTCDDYRIMRRFYRITDEAVTKKKRQLVHIDATSYDKEKIRTAVLDYLAAKIKERELTKSEHERLQFTTADFTEDKIKNFFTSLMLIPACSDGEIRALEVLEALSFCSDQRTLGRLVWLVIQTSLTQIDFLTSKQLQDQILAELGSDYDTVKTNIEDVKYEHWFGDCRAITRKEAERALGDDDITTKDVLSINFRRPSDYVVTLHDTINIYLRDPKQDAQGRARAYNLCEMLRQFTADKENSNEGLNAQEKKFYTLICALVFKSGSQELAGAVLKTLEFLPERLKKLQEIHKISNYEAWEKAQEINKLMTPHWLKFRQALLDAATTYYRSGLGGVDGRLRAQHCIAELSEIDITHLHLHENQYRVVLMADVIFSQFGNTRLCKTMAGYLKRAHVDVTVIKDFAKQYGISRDQLNIQTMMFKAYNVHCEFENDEGKVDAAARHGVEKLILQLNTAADYCLVNTDDQHIYNVALQVKCAIDIMKKKNELWDPPKEKWVVLLAILERFFKHKSFSNALIREIKICTMIADPNMELCALLKVYPMLKLAEVRDSVIDAAALQAKTMRAPKVALPDNARELLLMTIEDYQETANRDPSTEGYRRATRVKQVLELFPDDQQILARLLCAVMHSTSTKFKESILSYLGISALQLARLQKQIGIAGEACEILEKRLGDVSKDMSKTDVVFEFRLLGEEACITRDNFKSAVEAYTPERGSIGETQKTNLLTAITEIENLNGIVEQRKLAVLLRSVFYLEDAKPLQECILANLCTVTSITKEQKVFHLQTMQMYFNITEAECTQQIEIINNKKAAATITSTSLFSPAILKRAVQDAKGEQLTTDQATVIDQFLIAVNQAEKTLDTEQRQSQLVLLACVAACGRELPNLTAELLRLTARSPTTFKELAQAFGITAKMCGEKFTELQSLSRVDDTPLQMVDFPSS